MIIFDLDGTLADCEHRRHLIDPKKSKTSKFIFDDLEDLDDCLNLYGNYYFIGSENKWQPDWNAFYEACDNDVPIEPVCDVFRQMHLKFPEDMQQIHIWSGRSESVREKTEKWLTDHLHPTKNWEHYLKMRPIGNTEPDEVLKERWLDEYLNMPGLNEYRGTSNKVDFVFDDRPKVIRMWRRRRIFVFNCCQHDEEF